MDDLLELEGVGAPTVGRSCTSRPQRLPNQGTLEARARTSSTRTRLSTIDASHTKNADTACMHRLRHVVGLAAGLAVLSAPTSASGANPSYVAFRTPGSAAYCSYWPGWVANGGVEGGFHEGTSKDAAVECWTPNDGFNVRMSNRGRVLPVEYTRSLHGYKPRAKRVLAFGKTSTFHGIRCASRRTGLTCTNRDTHGWWIGRFHGYSIR